MISTTPARAHAGAGHTAQGNDQASRRSAPAPPDRVLPAITAPGIAAADGHTDPAELAQAAARQFMTRTAGRHPGSAASTLLRDVELARVNVAALLALLRRLTRHPMETGQPSHREPPP